MYDWFEWAIVAVVVIVLGGIVVQSVQETRLQRFCLAHGYARADWRVIGPNYCITRTDQTDVVVPVSEVK